MYKVEVNGNVDIHRIMALLSTTYWASGRTKATMETALSNSEYITVHADGALVGFARIVTDYATMFWLCDVVVERGHRGQGIGKMMMDHLSNRPYYAPLKGVLATDDAHGLYEQYGFVKEPSKVMFKNRKG